MPRKKKPTESLDSRGPDGEEEEEEKRNAANTKKKRSFVDAFIVISDSDGEQESKEESELQKKRTKQQLDRTKFAAKRKIAQMTEEEQFALALKMSEQEARQVNCQEEEEEELLRKAIAESLNSCQPLDSSDATPQLSAAALGTQGQSQPTEKEGSEILGGLALCPGTPRSEWSSHSQSSRADVNGQMDLTSIQHNRVSREGPARDKVKVTSGPWRLTPRRLFTSPSSSSEATGHEPKEQPLPCTGHSAGGAGAGSSYTLWKGRTAEQCGSPRRSGGGAGTKHTLQPGHATKVCVSTEQAEQNKVPDSTPDLCVLNAAEEKHKQEEVRDTVHYYWGIPFCPKGVDPNQYTKVILCQLEVYQKSLKQAQRQLLHKKEFGNPVVPSSSLSQNEFVKGEQISRENGVADDAEDGDPDGQKESESITWLPPSKRREAESPGHSMEEEKNSTSDDEPTTSYCQASQVLPAEDVRGDGEPMQIAQSISMLTPLGSKRSPGIATENSAEEEISICPETQQSPLDAIEAEREELCLGNRDAPMQAGGDEDGGRTVSECSPTAADCVLCPLCDQGFPAAEIELHAMYCNGIVGEEAGEDSPVLTRRQREARGKAASGESGSTSLGIDKCEKCYLCKSLVPLLQYQRHVDSCLQAARQAQGTRRLRSAKV
ncbi:UIMC1 protein, partial [Steatornis caripensis]|nr:UIMC1 protein [Steatornis caripensis]